MGVDVLREPDPVRVEDGARNCSSETPIRQVPSLCCVDGAETHLRMPSVSKIFSCLETWAGVGICHCFWDCVALLCLGVG